MCATCAYSASTTAAVGITGLRVWLQTRTWAWLTPRRLRRITIAPIQSLETAAGAAHEVGHVLGDLDSKAPWKPGEFGLGRICPSDEVNAWRWVLANTPIWERPMHARMAECLASYRPDATPEEARAIDEVCSDISFRLTQLRILGGELVRTGARGRPT